MAERSTDRIGFDALPPARRETARRGNDEGWTIQMTNIERHVAPR